MPPQEEAAQSLERGTPDRSNTRTWRVGRTATASEARLAGAESKGKNEAGGAGERRSCKVLQAPMKSWALF